MKRGITIVVFALFALLPAVSATLSLQGPDVVQVNFGGELHVSGSVTEAQDMTGLFKLILSCSTEQPLLIRSLSLKANQPKPFNEVLSVPSTVGGSCVLRAVFESGGAEVDSASSSSFTVTPSLVGDFSLSASAVSLGEKVTVRGHVSTLNGQPVTGTATLYFRLQGVDSFVTTLPVEDGEMSYLFTPEDFQSGQFDVVASVRDTYGNFQDFSVGVLTIEGNLKISVGTDATEYDPGDRVRITGTVMSLDQPLSRGKVHVKIGDRDRELVEEDTVSSGELSLSIMLLDDVTSGEHSVVVDIEDEHGNRGQSGFVITVAPRPTVLAFTVNKEEVVPGEGFLVDVQVLDQAADLMQGDVHVTIEDADGDMFFDEQVPSGDTKAFELTTDVAPGTWELAAEGFELQQTLTFTVLERAVLESTLEGQILTVTNVGNVRYKDTLHVSLEDGVKRYALDKKVNLKPGAFVTINLGAGMHDGTYAVSLAEQRFENVSVQGTPVKSIPWLLVLVILALLVILFFLAPRLYKRRAHKKAEESKPQPHDYEPAPVRFKDEDIFPNRGKYQPKKPGIFRSPEERRARAWQPPNPRAIPPVRKSRIPDEETMARQLNTTYELSKQNVKLDLAPRKQQDMFLFELPKKRERSQETPRDSLSPSSTVTSTSSWSDAVERYGTYPPEETKEKKDEKKGGGLFNMFG